MAGRHGAAAVAAALTVGVLGLNVATSDRASASPVSHHTVRGDFNGDGYADLAVGVPNGSGGIGAVEIVYGSASGLTAAASQYFTLDTPGLAGPRGVAGDLFGYSLAVGNFNGDRYADLAVGAPGAEGVVVLYGSALGLTANGSQFLPGGGASGSSLAAGDFNADGYDDLAVGQPNANAKGVGAGDVEVHYGTRSGLNGVARGTSQLLSAATAGMAGGGPSLNLNFGLSLATGHFKGEPVADLAIAENGAVTVAYGSAAGLTTAGSQLLADYQGSGGGATVVAAGDFNGDAIDDLAVGEPTAATSTGNAGAIEVHYGSLNGLRNVSVGTARAFAEITPGMAGPGTAGNDEFGAALVVADFNGAGFDDLAVGVPGKSAAIVLFGSAKGITVHNSQYLAGIGPQAGSQSFPQIAVAVAAGDFNGDGRADLVLGEPFTDTTQTAAGVAEEHDGSSAGLIDVSQGTAPVFSETASGMPGPPPGTEDFFGFALAAGGTVR